MLDWITSYLRGRTQCVRVGLGVSAPQTLMCGTPQGSVVSPVLLSLYTTPLQDITMRYGFEFVMYADDTQNVYNLLTW